MMDPGVDWAPTEPVFYRFLYTSVAGAFAIAVLVAGLFWDINVVALRGIHVIGLEQTELSEVAIAFLMIVPAFFVDRIVSRERAHAAQLQAERLRVLRLTIRTVQDLVNNELTELQLLRVEADGLVAEETLALFDGTIRKIASQLTALGDMQVFAEKPMEMGAGLDCPAVA